MKRIIQTLIVISVLFPNIVMAQDSVSLSPKMELFKEYCLRVSKAAANCDVDELIDCISQWEPDVKGKEQFKYRNTLLNCTPMAYDTIDKSGETSIYGHNQFMPEYVDSLIVNKCMPMEIVAPPLLRSRNVFECAYLVQTIKPHGKVSYLVFDCADDIELFVVSENGGMLNLYVKDEENSHTYSDTSPDGKPCVQLKWNMYYSGDIEVTIENLSENAISFIMVMN